MVVADDDDFHEDDDNDDGGGVFLRGVATEPFLSMADIHWKYRNKNISLVFNIVTWFYDSMKFWNLTANRQMLTEYFSPNSFSLLSVCLSIFSFEQNNPCSVKHENMCTRTSFF